MATQSIPKITEEEYLRLERAAESKSEFVDGEIFPMPGGTFRHAELAMNVGSALIVQLRGQKCKVLSSDARVRTPSSGSFVYPDVTVVRGTPEGYQSGSDNLLNPTVIVEVLSPSTADYDRGKKFQLYREITTLADYILVHATSPLIEHFARQPDASWTFREYQGIERSVRIASINCTIQLADLYAGVFDLPE